MTEQTTTPASKRLASLDALRGFDMFFIMGGASLIAAICALWPESGFAQWLSSQMGHVEWEGLRHHDTIFPLFLFIAGIAFPFSLAKQIERGKTHSQIVKKVLFRGLMLVILGMIYNGMLKLDFAHLRFPSVLARIGLAWMCGALIFMHTKTRTRIWITAVLLIGYYLIAGFVHAPDSDPSVSIWSVDGSFICYVDRLLMPNHIYQPNYDPEGIMGIISATGTALLGMFTGEWVKREDVSGTKKTLYMVFAGIALLIIGLLWSLVYPVNKALWSSTFVVLVASYSVLIFALFYWIIDVKGWKNWILFFTVIGMNSITIYVGQSFINFRYTADKVFGGLVKLFPENIQPILSGAAFIAICWLFLYFLYKKKVFLKV